MNTPVIRVEDIGKEYQVGVSEPGYRTLREAIVSAASAPWRRFRHLSGRARQNHRFWALREINFEVQQGEIVGIIGRNGAGKSTLLKILSQITEPTTGMATLDGRVGSLLEVGGGFHPELTGRENVFLKGAMLGMSKRETTAKFDEIVSFAEVEKFIDTPVKRFSSGMYTRLAFSVAAHLDPEIVIVDEVLAVGDAAFQQKCIGKMGEVAHDGRTVLFVSHNSAAVETLCTRVILLQSGQIIFDGKPCDAIGRYFNAAHSATLGSFQRTAEELSTFKGRACITSASINSVEGADGKFPIGAPISLVVECVCEQVDEPNLGIGISDFRGLRVMSFNTVCDPSTQLPRSVRGKFRFICSVPRQELVPGRYSVKLALGSKDCFLDVIEDALQFTVMPTDFFGNYGRYVGGIVFAKQSWQIECTN
ncbi:MAG TPA: ABC transporter ATP-binding protein [Pirellulales bacterium]|nr:ABC transporter ATP-binding protein [Pirellulales bacterium]